MIRIGKTKCTSEKGLLADRSEHGAFNSFNYASTAKGWGARMAFKDNKPSFGVAKQRKLKVINELHHLKDACHFSFHFARKDYYI